MSKNIEKTLKEKLLKLNELTISLKERLEEKDVLNPKILNENIFNLKDILIDMKMLNNVYGYNNASFDIKGELDLLKNIQLYLFFNKKIINDLIQIEGNKEIILKENTSEIISNNKLISNNVNDLIKMIQIIEEIQKEQDNIYFKMKDFKVIEKNIISNDNDLNINFFKEFNIVNENDEIKELLDLFFFDELKKKEHSIDLLINFLLMNEVIISKIINEKTYVHILLNEIFKNKKLKNSEKIVLNRILKINE